MLKLQYNENGLYMDRVNSLLEPFVAQRVTLMVRAGQSLHVQSGRACFLLPAKLPTLWELESIVGMDGAEGIHLCRVDAETVEVSVPGLWMTEALEAEDGLFLMSGSEAIESLLHHLWQQGEQLLSSLA